jgi:energy-converting hydrogenase Eha subunit B
MGSAVVMVGGERRVTRRMKLLTENYVFDDGAILSAGVRFIGDRLSADLGLAVPIGAEESIVFPVVNFVWLF